MRWASRLATEFESPAAVEAALAGLEGELDGASVDLVLVFASPHFEPLLPGLHQRVLARFPNARLLGCTAGGVVGDEREIERGPGLALVGASLPGVTVRPFFLRQSETTSTLIPTGSARCVVVLSDPYTIDSDAVVQRIEGAIPGATIVGGLVAGGTKPYENRLLVDGAVYSEGAAGVVLSGNLVVDTVVAQGCRPIGPPLFVTRAERNILYSLDGKPAMTALQEVLNGLDASDRDLARQALFLGVLPDSAQQRCEAGAFLIRNLVGLDPRSGALVVGARLVSHGVVQFHLRDAATAAEALDRGLQQVREVAERPAAGALLLSCLGRGSDLFGVPDHELTTIRAQLGPIPVGGLFCNGEIGPVHGKTHLHGYTSVLALFRARVDA